MNETTTQIMERLDLLAAKLGVTAEHMWGVLVKQAVVEGTYGVVGIALGVACCLVGLWTLSKSTNKVSLERADRDESFVAFMSYALTPLVAAVLVLFGCVSVYVGIASTQYFFNPEYFALREITGFLR